MKSARAKVDKAAERLIQWFEIPQNQSVVLTSRDAKREYQQQYRWLCFCRDHREANANAQLAVEAYERLQEEVARVTVDKVAEQLIRWLGIPENRRVVLASDDGQREYRQQYRWLCVCRDHREANGNARLAVAEYERLQEEVARVTVDKVCLLYTSPSPRD